MTRPITLTSPLPAEDLRFESMAVSEGLSLLGEMRVGLLSKKADLEPEDLLGKPITVSVTLRDDARRHLHGYVTRFGIGPHRGDQFGYQAIVRPWLWFLTRTSDCRIFQEMSVPDIVRKVFEDHGIASFEFKLFRQYRTWPYCVQYRESDYNFVARLLEHEGIYWYFQHTEGDHKLVLVDSQSVHDVAPGCEALPYYANAGEVPPDTQYVSAWSFTREVRTGKVVLTSYDFERPSAAMKVDVNKTRVHDLGDYEMFDFQGDYVQAADGSQWAEDRMDELQTRFAQLHGASNAHGIEAGHLLKLERHPREDQNAEYLVTGLSINAHVDPQESGGSAGTFQCDFSAIPSSQQFRPLRRTPKPFVQGPQTAMVVGPPGEEIHTDKYGRVKVKFHWDRDPAKNETSSCWMRVSQPWAGKGWGGVSIPRIGQEVIVDFLEGDPDQPIITGRVYNAEAMPPFALPAGAVINGMKSQTHKGAGYNELSMDDTAGKEKIVIHGQYDMDTTVLHDQSSTVKNNRTDKVDVDDSETVGNNQKLTVGVHQEIKIGSNRTEQVGGAESITITGHRHEEVNSGEDVTINGSRSHTVNGTATTTISIAEAHTVGAGRAHSVGGGEAITVGAAQVVSVGGAQMVSVGAVQRVNVGASQSTAVGGSQSTKVASKQSTEVGADRGIKVGGGQATTVGKGRSASVAEDDAVKVGKNFSIQAGESITLGTGSASIQLKKDGTIVIKGKDVTVSGSGKINVKASGDLILKGSKIKQN